MPSNGRRWCGHNDPGDRVSSGMARVRREQAGIRRGAALAIAGLVGIALLWVSGAVPALPGLGVADGGSPAPGPSLPGGTPGGGLAQGSLGGPTAIYQVDDATTSRLLSLRLDGRSQAQTIAEQPRPGDEGTYGWHVEPRGRRSLFLAKVAAGLSIVAFDGHGAASRWTAEAAIVVDPADGVWSNDGRWWGTVGARLEDIDEDRPDGRAVILDVSTGGLVAVDLKGRPWPQGITDDGRLVVLEQTHDALGDVIDWRFQAVEAATGLVVPARVGDHLPVGGHSFSAGDAHLAAGLATARTRIGDQAGGTGRQLELVDLRTDARTPIGPVDLDPNWVAFLPDGRTLLMLIRIPREDRVAGEGDDTSALLASDRAGAIREVWRGKTQSSWPIVLAADGDYVGWTRWDLRGGPVLEIVELSSGRDARLPLPDRLAGASLEAIIGGQRLPIVAVASTPAPSIQPPISADAVPMEGAPWLVQAEVQVRDDLRSARVEILAPAIDGGLARIATMPPLVIPGRGEPEFPGSLQVAVRPDGGLVVVRFDHDGVHDVWLWTPGAGRRPFAAMDAIDGDTHGFVWRPDGRAIAAVNTIQVDDFSEATRVVILDPAGEFDPLIHPAPDLLGGIAGWTDDGGAVVLTHGVCTEGCPFEHPWRWTMDPLTGALDPVDRTDVGVGLTGAMSDVDQQGDLRLHYVEPWAGNENIVVTLPDHDGDPGSTGADAVGRDLFVTAPQADGGSIVLRLRDPLAHVTAGRATVEPIELGRLRAGMHQGSVDASGRWVLAQDATRTRWLIDLRTDDAIDLGNGTTLDGWIDWASAGGW